MGTQAIVSKLLKTGIIQLTSLKTQPRFLSLEVFNRLLQSGLLKSRDYDNEFVVSYNTELEAVEKWLKNEGLDKSLTHRQSINQREQDVSILGWSMSRYETFLWCKRQYYYTYYPQHDVLSERIKFLKALTSLPLAFGIVTHHVIETILKRLVKSQEPIQQVKVLQYARNTLEQHVSSQKFREIYYHEIDSIDLDEITEKVCTVLTNFLRSDRFSWLTSTAIQHKEQWMIEPGGFGESRISGIKAYFKVDFLLPSNGKQLIFDWKTGQQKTETHRKQLIGYACWATSHFNTSADLIVPIVAYLHPAYEEVQLTANDEDIQQFKEQLNTETQKMYAFCRDVSRNIPKERAAFPKTDDDTRCCTCQFKELCDDSSIH